MSIGNKSHAAADLYPAKYFDWSPTYNSWVKLSIASCIHELQRRPGFEGQDVYFLLNHPIRYVYLVGIVAAIDYIQPYLTIITLDDSSGACIDLVVNRPKEFEDSTETPVPGLRRVDTIGNPCLFLGGKRVHTGMTVKAKGEINEFRGLRQIRLRRLTHVKDTTEETAAWTSMAEFYGSTLSHPWILSPREQSACDAKLQKLAAKGKLESEREILRSAELARRMHDLELKAARREARHEQRRAAEEAELNEGALI